MPRRLTIDTAVEREAKLWVRSIIRTQMVQQSSTYRDLAERLAAIGLDENERNIANKVARGELSAMTFLLCLKAMGCEAISLTDRSFETALQSLDNPLTMDQALTSDLIDVVERDDDAGVFRIRIGTISTPITIFLSRLNNDVRPTLSHVIVAPGHRGLGINMPSASRSPQLALKRIVRLLVNEYQRGIEKGFSPDETWLVPVNTIRKRQALGSGTD